LNLREKREQGDKEELYNFGGDHVKEMEGVHDSEQKCIQKFGKET
jgi:hypothetical protein